MDTVRFHIFRKAAFAGCLLTYELYINGEFVGTLKNGKILEAIVPRARLYYMDEAWSFNERNGYFEDDGSDEYFITIKRAGGWKTNSYMEFYKRNTDQMINLPSFECDKFWSAIVNDDEFAQLRECEKIFARCLEFQNDINDDIDALLCNEHYHEMLAAVKQIGANGVYNAITSLVSEQFSPDFELPFNDSQGSCFKRSAVSNGNKAPDGYLKNGAYEELHKCLVSYLTQSII